jgi:act minimal PKS acyl carrier protein
MSELTLVDLKKIMKECAGADESIDLDGDILDTGFDALGYDSLALLETTSRIERAYDVRLGDEAATESGTPREFLDRVNGAIAAA